MGYLLETLDQAKLTNQKDVVRNERRSLARDSNARSLPGLFETTLDAASSIRQLFVYGLPLDYYSALPKRIEAVTAAQVHRVANLYLNPDKMAVVAVGDRATIEPELKKLSLGPIAVRPAAEE
jgi:zinc protease